jgi:HAD superfamily hydrolase (TIGR01509 family)
MTRAVFFDVDFTLIYPGPTLQSECYGLFCARHGVTVDTSLFRTAVGMAAPVLDEVKAHNYDAQLFIDYTRAIIEQMGGRGPGADRAARDIYDEWAACHHFFLYDDVEPALRRLAGAGLKIGLISNTQRPLDEFAAHFALENIFSAAISSAELGFLKPHPAIFEAALAAVGEPAGAAVMVGDSVKADIEGARQIGMRAVLVRRTGAGLSSPLQHALAPGYQDVPVIGSLAELPALLLPGAETLTAAPESLLPRRSPADMPGRKLGADPGEGGDGGPE